MSYFWKTSQCNTTFDLKINLGHSDLYLMVQWFLSFLFCSEKHFSFIGKAQFRRAVLSCDSSYCYCFACSPQNLTYVASQMCQKPTRPLRALNHCTRDLWSPCQALISLPWLLRLRMHTQLSTLEQVLAFWKRYYCRLFSKDISLISCCISFDQF